MNRQELIRRVDHGSRVRKHQLGMVLLRRKYMHMRARFRFAPNRKRRDVSGFHSRMGLKMTLRWLEPDTWAAEYGDDYYD